VEFKMRFEDYYENEFKNFLQIFLKQTLRLMMICWTSCLSILKKSPVIPMDQT
jgi:hypothetical protein